MNELDQMKQTAQPATNASGADNQAPGNAPKQPTDSEQEAEQRLFTQTELERILSERIARLKRGDDLREKESELNAREVEITRRENEYQARQELKAEGLNEAYLPLVDLTDSETVTQSIQKIKTATEAAGKEKSEKRPPAIIIPQNNRPIENRSDVLRKAFFGKDN